MMKKKVLVCGFGKRVREAALPAIAACEGLELAGIVARRARQEGGHEVGALKELSSLEGVDVVYLAVGKDATPAVLGRLASLDASKTDLLVETPVVRFKHFCHVRSLAAFRRVSVAEDCAYLPWFDTVRAAREAGLLGEPRDLLLHHSAYAYHGLATAKALLGAARIRGGSRSRAEGGIQERRIRFSGGTSAVVHEPRDYSIGTWTLTGTEGAISDHVGSAPGAHHLEVLVEGGLVTGFRIGELQTHLTEAEQALTGGSPPDASVTARQEAMKRVGFLRIWDSIAAGEAAYPLADGLDDMVVDYHLEKLGRYVANPFTSPRSPLARALLGSVTRLAGLRAKPPQE